MNSKEFKTFFSETANKFGFQKAFGGWFKESLECIVILVLQKSYFGDYYEFIIKIYIQGVFGMEYILDKNLVKNDIGDVRSGEPKEYRDTFNFEEAIDVSVRQEKLEKLFAEFICPLTDKVLTRSGIIELYNKDKLFLLPAVKKELGLG